jgi:hypothetical protein
LSSLRFFLQETTLVVSKLSSLGIDRAYFVK